MGGWDYFNFLGPELTQKLNRQPTNNILQYVPSACLPVHLAPDDPATAQRIYDEASELVDNLASGCGVRQCIDEFPAVRFLLPGCNQFNGVPFGHFFRSFDEFADYSCTACQFPISELIANQGDRYETSHPLDLFPGITAKPYRETRFAPGIAGSLMYNYADGPGNQGIPTRWDPICPNVPRHYPVHTMFYDAAACSGLEPWLTGLLFHRDNENTKAFFASCGVYNHMGEVVGAEDYLRALMELRDDFLANAALNNIEVDVWQAAISPCEQTESVWSSISATGCPAYSGCCMDPDTFIQLYGICPGTTDWKTDWDCCYCSPAGEGSCDFSQYYRPKGGFRFYGSSVYSSDTQPFRLHGTAPVTGGSNRTIGKCGFDECVTGTFCCFVEEKLGTKDFGPEKYSHLRLRDTWQIDCFFTEQCKHLWYPGHRYFYLDEGLASQLVSDTIEPATGYRVSRDLLYELVTSTSPQINAHIARSNLYLFRDWPLFMINEDEFDNRCLARYPWPEGIGCGPTEDPCVKEKFETGSGGFRLYGSGLEGGIGGLRFHGDAPVDGGQPCSVKCPNPFKDRYHPWGPINEKNFLLRCLAGDRATMLNPDNLCFTCKVGGTDAIYLHRLWMPQITGTPYDPLSHLDEGKPYRVFAPRYYEGHGTLGRLLESNAQYYLVYSDWYNNNTEPCCTVINNLKTMVVDRDTGTHFEEQAHGVYLGDHIIPKFAWQDLGDNDNLDPSTYCANNTKGLKIAGTVVGRCGPYTPLNQPGISQPSNTTKMIVPVDFEAFDAELTQFAHTDDYQPVGCNVPVNFVKGYDRQTKGDGTSTLTLVNNAGAPIRTTTFALSRRVYKRKGFARQGTMFWLDGVCNPTTDEYYSGVPCQDLNPTELEVTTAPNQVRELTIKDGCVGTDPRCGKGIPITDDRCTVKKICIDPHVTDYELALIQLHPLYADGYECGVNSSNDGYDYCQNTCINRIVIYDVLQNDANAFEVKIGNLFILQTPGQGVLHLGNNCDGEAGYQFTGGYYIEASLSVSHIKIDYTATGGASCDGASGSMGGSPNTCEDIAGSYMTSLPVGKHIFGGGIDQNLLLTAMNSVPFQGVVDGACVCSENFSRYLKWDAGLSMSIKPYITSVVPTFTDVFNAAPNATTRVSEALTATDEKDGRGYLYGIVPPWGLLADSGASCPADFPLRYKSPDADVYWFTESLTAGATTLSQSTLQQYGYTRDDAVYGYDIKEKLNTLRNNNPNDPHDIPLTWGPATHAALLFRIRKAADKMGTFDPLSGCEMETGETPPLLDWPTTATCLPNFKGCCAWCDPNTTGCESNPNDDPCYLIGCPRDIDDGGCPSACDPSGNLVSPAPTAINNNYPCEEQPDIDFIVYPCLGSNLPPIGGGGGGGTGGSGTPSGSFGGP